MESGDENSLPALLEELDGPLDDENPDVAITDDDTGWMLSVFQSGRLIWENPEEGPEEPRHMVDIPRSETLRIMSLVATGDLAAVESLNWRPGYQ